MSKEKEDIIGIIPRSEYIDELEVDVRYHVARIGETRKVPRKIHRTKYPDKFKDRREELDFQIEEIRRCREGYGGINGKMYFWYNYCYLRNPKRGKILPDFKTINLEWFETIEKYQKTGKGIVSIKRRRIGASWMEAADALHDASFTPFSQIGMNSKSENDSRNLFKNIKFIHQNLPDWLRATATASDRRDYMEFAKNVKDDSGNKSKKGNQSWILSVAPTATAHEGNAYTKLIMDEGGKYDVMEMWKYSEDCMMLDTERVGMPIVFGTVGDITKEGKGLMEMWKNNTAYDMVKFGMWGYNGLIVDDFGNDMIEDAVRWIIYTRHKKQSATKKVREAFIQKYPLDENDAFNHVTSGGVGDSKLINEQIINLMGNPPLKRVGWMRKKPNGGVDFVPNPDGQVIIYDLPDHGRSNGFVANCDPIEDDDVEKNRDSSDIAFTIMAKPYGLMPPKLVAEFAMRPPKVDDAFEQIAMLCIWYNNTKVQIEMNKGGWRMRKYFETHYPQLLALAPVSATSAKGGVEWRIGVKMTAERKQQMMGLIEDYIDNHVKHIPSIRLLEQFKVFGEDHADDDVAVSFGWDLILMQSDKTIVRNREQASTNNPSVTYVKRGNQIVLVTPEDIRRGENAQPQKPRPKSALFKF